jgi:hypothetical protein
MTIKKIFSKVTPQQLLASILDSVNLTGRIDSADTGQILQVSAIRLPQAKQIRAHKHKDIARNTVGTQEAWVLISGHLLAKIYDTNGSLIEVIPLGPGMSLTLYNGGHSFEVISNSVVIFEIKNGPYYGAELDSQPID